MEGKKGTVEATDGIIKFRYDYQRSFSVVAGEKGPMRWGKEKKRRDNGRLDFAAFRKKPARKNELEKE